MDEITRFPAVRLFRDGRIITIPQGTNKHRLPLFYALPKEIVSKTKEYLDFPRCPYDPIWTDKYDEHIKKIIVHAPDKSSGKRKQKINDDLSDLVISGFCQNMRRALKLKG